MCNIEFLTKKITRRNERSVFSEGLSDLFNFDRIHNYNGRIESGEMYWLDKTVS